MSDTKVGKLMSALFALVNSLNPAVAAFLGVTATLVAIFTYIHDTWAFLLTKFTSLTMWESSGVSFSAVGLIDTFVPLNTLLDLTSAYLALLLAASVVRTVKSFIPTIAT